MKWVPITDVEPVIDGDDENEESEREEEAAENVEIELGSEVNQLDSLEKTSWKAREAIGRSEVDVYGDGYHGSNESETGARGRTTEAAT